MLHLLGRSGVNKASVARVGRRRADAAAQQRTQLSWALNLCIVAVGLPLAWYAVVSWKNAAAVAARLHAPAPQSLADVAREEQERLAVQLLVDERRVARGAAPYFAPRLPGDQLG